jgi:predicted branched-subunit amino acid permease
MPSSGPKSLRRKLGTAAPPAGAIFVFGTIYGAASHGLLDTPLTLLSSALIFSGALQFALIGLLSAGATMPAILITGATLNLRHIVLGAVLRPKLSESRLRRALLSWFLIDESFGLALAAGEDSEPTLVASGSLFYVSWLVGTAVGVLGAGLSSLQGVANAVFPVLFIGLAAMTSTRLHHAGRAVIAAALTAALVLSTPGIRGLAPLLAAIAVALPGRQE